MSGPILKPDHSYFFDIIPLIIFLTVPKEFLAMKATIEAITTLEGKSTLLATASVLSKISLALLTALLIDKATIIKATAIIRKIMDQMTTRTIKAISKIDMNVLSHELDMFSRHD